MGKTKATGRPRERRVAPGVIERHTKECASSRSERRGCDCVPAFMARVRTGPRGNQTSISETFGTLPEAVAWIGEARRLQHSGEHPAPRKPVPAFRQAAADFLARARSGKALNRSGDRYSPKTLENYDSVLRTHALTFVSGRTGRPLGELPADDVDRRLLQNLVDHVAAEKSGGLARQTVAAVIAVLRDLDRRELIDGVPAKPTLPAPPRKRDRHLSVDEADRVLTAAAEDDEKTGRSLMHPLVAVLVATGCRLGEALALRWGPGGLDLGAATVTVTRESTKTDAGARTVGVEAEYIAVLRRHRLATGRPGDGELVFTNEAGGMLNRGGRVRAGLNRLRKATGVDFTAHTLRHTQGSQLAAAGENATDIAARLGHSDASFTLKTYVHANAQKTAGTPTNLAAYRERERSAKR